MTRSFYSSRTWVHDKYRFTFLSRSHRYRLFKKDRGFMTRSFDRHLLLQLKEMYHEHPDAILTKPVPQILGNAHCRSLRRKSNIMIFIRSDIGIGWEIHTEPIQEEKEIRHIFLWSGRSGSLSQITIGANTNSTGFELG